MKESMTQNNFEVLSIPEDQLFSTFEEGEVPQTQIQTSEEDKGHESELNTPVEGHSPTYAEMAKKGNLLTILVHLKKIQQRGHPKKGVNLKRQFGRKKLKVLRYKEVKPLLKCQSAGRLGPDLQKEVLSLPVIVNNEHHLLELHGGWETLQK